jgi:hypothetical protein
MITSASVFYSPLSAESLKINYELGPTTMFPPIGQLCPDFNCVWESPCPRAESQAALRPVPA